MPVAGLVLGPAAPGRAPRPPRRQPAHVLRLDPGRRATSRSSSDAFAWLDGAGRPPRALRCSAGATPGWRTCSGGTTIRSPSSTGRQSPSALASSTSAGCLLPPVLPADRRPLRLSGMPGVLDAHRCRRPPTRPAPVTTVEDLDWYLVYAELRQALTSIRVSSRAVHFGERPAPDDPAGPHHRPRPPRGGARSRMTNPIGPLTPADEGFCHQIVDTFAVVGSTDLSWTEKVCAVGDGHGRQPAARLRPRQVQEPQRDGRLRRRSRGVEQITVRASRRLAHRSRAHRRSARSATRSSSRCSSVRFVLEPNDEQPIAFDWLFEAALPPRSRTARTIARRLPRLAPSSCATTRSAVLGVDRGRRRARPR